jgi:multiple sugar transport system permease protein
LQTGDDCFKFDYSRFKRSYCFRLPFDKFLQVFPSHALLLTCFLILCNRAVNGYAIWDGIGYAAIILLAGLQSIPRNYYEAASIDGAGPWYRFIRITVPLLSPTIFFLTITSMISAFKAFDLIFMFASSGNSTSPTTEAIRTMVFGIYQKGFLLRRMGYAAAEAVVLFGLILLVTVIQFRLQKKLVYYD